MTAQARIRTIQTICWVGVAADALWAVALIYPPFYGLLTGRPNLQADLVLRLTMGIGGSLMAGWTFLLAWTALKPIARRFILLITVLPVLAGLSIVTGLGILYGNTSNIWILAKCALLSIAMLTGYHMANVIAREAAIEINY